MTCVTTPPSTNPWTTSATRSRPRLCGRPSRSRWSRGGHRFQTLLGITGSGTVLASSKSLAPQLANKFREYFPESRVGYFASYYDHYQPGAYMVSSDTNIDKDATVNDEIDRLRREAWPWILECWPGSSRRTLGDSRDLSARIAQSTDGAERRTTQKGR